MKQKIIVTWGAWFIGSNFLNKYVLLHPEIDFINIDALTYAGKLENISEEVQKSLNYFFEKCDIRDISALEKVYAKYSPTDIIHFAAESHVDNSIKNPMIFTETNVIWTQNLLECHKKFGLKRFHHISTDEVYWDLPNWWFFTEQTSLNPSSPYSSSKASSDFYVKAYGRTFWIDYVITRCSNNYWPNQDTEKLIPHFIDLLQKNEKVTVYWDGSNIRDWLYVEDHCDAIWEVFTKAQNKSIYNIWGNNEYTNLEITKLILKEMNKWEEYISFVEDRKGHDVRYAIDATKIRNELWWEPKIKFENGIVRTIQYFLKKEKKSDIDIIQYNDNISRLLKWNNKKIELLKETIAKKESRIYFRECEVWWCQVWENLWTEIYWKWDDFTRPVLIIKKTWKNSFIWIPATTKFNNIRNKTNISEKIILNWKESVFLFHQAKNFDKIRLQRRISELSENVFTEILEKFLDSIKTKK